MRKMTWTRRWAGAVVVVAGFWAGVELGQKTVPPFVPAAPSAGEIP